MMESRIDAGLKISNGYVVYQRGAESAHDYWRYVHRKAVNDANNLASKIKLNSGYDLAQLGATGNYLIELGRMELEKERNVLMSCLGTNFNTQGIAEIGYEINDLVAQKERLHTALVQLKELALRPRSLKQNRKFSSRFVDQFGTIVSNKLYEFTSKLGVALTNENFSTYEAQLQQISQDSLDEALDAAISQSANDQDGEYYNQLRMVLQIFPQFHGRFREVLQQHIDFSKLQTILTSVSGKGKTGGIRTAVDKAGGFNLKNKRNTTYFAKSTKEVVDQIITELGTSLESSQGKSARISLPDSFEIFSTEEIINFDFLEQLDLSNDPTNDLLFTAVREMENYYNQYLSRLDQSLVVYQSFSPRQNLNELRQFNGLNPIEDLEVVFDRLSTLSTQDVYDFINILRNTGRGAYFEDKSSEVYANLEVAIMNAFAHLLLWDWDISGEFFPTGQQIFVIQLGGRNVPLSTLYTAVGRAFLAAAANQDLLMTAYIELPGEIKYWDPIIPTSKDPMDEVIKAWNEQAKETTNETMFAIRFVQEFENIVYQYLR